ncbi:MAG: cytochrome c3 family protein [Planctomycetes bacterium]|nr:cytochrome c3 family protein [Planctomycetota bacterium]
MSSAPAILAAAMLAAVAVGQTYTSTLAGTPHDWRNRSSATNRRGEFCAVCHIPHVEGRPLDRTNEKLLWSRQMSTLNYTMYSSPSLNGLTSGTGNAQVDGSSRLCLSCHDGTLTSQLFHTNTNPGTRAPMSGSIRIGLPSTGTPTGDLTSDHPFSITYNWGTGAGQDPYLKDPNTLFGGIVAGQRIADVLEPSSIGPKVQCATCHDIHNNEVPPQAEYLLRIWNNDPANPSALCTACHDK